MEIKFSSDTKYRKEWLTGLHFAHPAKMHLSLQLWLIDRYTKEGEVILDPMAGSGTILVACSTGRNVICVELEDKFVKMIKGNWGKIQQRGCQLGYQMGTATILQGDARNLPDMLADVVITSPPYEAVVDGTGEGPSVTSKRNKSYKRMPNSYTEKADVIMTSPPYAESLQGEKTERDRQHRIDIGRNPDSPGSHNLVGYSDSPANLGNLKYGDIEDVLKKGNGVFVDCGEAFFNLPSLSSQGEGMIVTASFTSKVCNEVKQEFSMFFLDSEEWNNLRQKFLEVGIFGHCIFVDQQTAEGSLLLNIEPKLREVLNNPRPSLFIANGNLDAGTQPCIAIFPLLDNIETPLAIKQACHISQFNSVHQFNNNTSKPVSQLPYGNIDCVITSPPYEEAMGEKHHSPRADKLAQEKSNPVTYTDRVDCVITSPPYEDNKPFHDAAFARKMIQTGIKPQNYSEEALANKTGDYGNTQGNIGNLKDNSYLSAMLEVYQGCWRVLKPQGLMILVTKNFIRNKQEIRLDFDTIRLCEQAGFRFAVRHYRKLTSQSFWRTIYQQKYPDAPILDKEDILIFQK